MKKSLFEMNGEEWDTWIESDEGQDFVKRFLEVFEETFANEPAYYSELCWKFSCPFNSEHNTSEVSIGKICYCTKFKKGEKNTCEEIFEGEDGDLY